MAPKSGSGEKLIGFVKRKFHKLSIRWNKQIIEKQMANIKKYQDWKNFSLDEDDDMYEETYQKISKKQKFDDEVKSTAKQSLKKKLDSVRRDKREF